MIGRGQEPRTSAGRLVRQGVDKLPAAQPSRSRRRSPRRLRVSAPLDSKFSVRRRGLVGKVPTVASHCVCPGPAVTNNDVTPVRTPVRDIRRRRPRARYHTEEPRHGRPQGSGLGRVLGGSPDPPGRTRILAGRPLPAKIRPGIRPSRSVRAPHAGSRSPAGNPTPRHGYGNEGRVPYGCYGYEPRRYAPTDASALLPGGW